MEPSIAPPVAYPGNHQHQRLLQAMTEYCARQPWALAFIVFGSLARGDWDAYSDLDLDVVVADEATIAPLLEVERMCAAIGERITLAASRRGDDADVVLASLAQFSIRYHRLAATSPNIISGMHVLWSRIDPQRVHAAGAAHSHPAVMTDETLRSLCVRAVLEGAHALARGRRWAALAALEEVRDNLMTLYIRAHGGERPLRDFERRAEPELQDALAGTLASYDVLSIRAGLLVACDLLEQRLPAFCNQCVALTDGERALLTQTRAQLTGDGV